MDSLVRWTRVDESGILSDAEDYLCRREQKLQSHNHSMKDNIDNEDEDDDEEEGGNSDIHIKLLSLKLQEAAILNDKWQDSIAIRKLKSKWWELKDKEFNPNLRFNHLKDHYQEELMDVWLKHKSFEFYYLAGS